MFALFRLSVAGMIITSLLAGSARADMGYIPPVNVHLQFENLDDFPQYDFYLKYGIGQGNPYVGLRLMKVPSSGMFKLEGEGRRLTEVYLLAVPRGQSVAPPKEVDNESWLRFTPSKGLNSDPISWMSQGNLLNHEQSTSIHRIDIKGNQLTTTWISGQEPRRPLDMFTVIIVSGWTLSALVVTAGLLLIARWFRRSKRAKSESGETHEK